MTKQQEIIGKLRTFVPNQLLAGIPTNPIQGEKNAQNFSIKVRKIVLQQCWYNFNEWRYIDIASLGAFISGVIFLGGSYCFPANERPGENLAVQYIAGATGILATSYRLYHHWRLQSLTWLVATEIDDSLPQVYPSPDMTAWWHASMQASIVTLLHVAEVDPDHLAGLEALVGHAGKRDQFLRAVQAALPQFQKNIRKATKSLVLARRGDVFALIAVLVYFSYRLSHPDGYSLNDLWMSGIFAAALFDLKKNCDPSPYGGEMAIRWHISRFNRLLSQLRIPTENKQVVTKKQSSVVPSKIGMGQRKKQQTNSTCKAKFIHGAALILSMVTTTIPMFFVQTVYTCLPSLARQKQPLVEDKKTAPPVVKDVPSRKLRRNLKGAKLQRRVGDVRKRHAGPQTHPRVGIIVIEPSSDQPPDVKKPAIATSKVNIIPPLLTEPSMSAPERVGQKQAPTTAVISPNQDSKTALMVTITSPALLGSTPVTVNVSENPTLPPWSRLGFSPNQELEILRATQSQLCNKTTAHFIEAEKLRIQSKALQEKVSYFESQTLCPPPPKNNKNKQSAAEPVTQAKDSY